MHFPLYFSKKICYNNNVLNKKKVITIAHLVKCTVCRKTFDRDKEQAVKDGARRYAHYKCKPDGELVPLPQKEVKNQDLKDLEDYIAQLYGDKANWVLIKKQIKTFQKEYKFTLTGIKKTLIYFYEVKGNSPDKSNGGIGIVPYCYNDSRTYYYNLYLAQEQNKKKDIKEYTKKIKEFIIKPPKTEKKTRLFFIDEFLTEEDSNSVESE